MFAKQKQLLVVGLFIVLGSLFASFTITDTAFADPYTADSNGGSCKEGDTTFNDTNTQIKMCMPNTTSDDPTAKDETADEETCAVDKIGWILCPIIERAAVISDKAFETLADNFLRTDPQLFDDKSGTRIAWEISRNLANIMFIIAFLIIIISQVTSYGISNYGIKKMLPRLIVAALAVNV